MSERFGLYLVLTDPVAGYEACAEAAVACGVRYVQLRMKAVPRDEVLRTASRLRAITRGSATRLIINDDVTVAREVDADGVHLGQDDLRLDEARRLWPSDEAKIFGLSTHSLTQARAALALAPDYIGVGPVFVTPTKPNIAQGLGVAQASAMVRAVKLTCVAIGGVDATRLPALLAAGISNFAVVRYVCGHPRPREPIEELLAVRTDSRGTGL